MEKTGNSWKQAKEEKQKEMVARMKSELNLTADQAKRVQGIFSDANAKAEPIIEQKKEIYKNAKTQVRGLLSEDQQKKWEALKTEWKSGAKKEHGW